MTEFLVNHKKFFCRLPCIPSILINMITYAIFSRDKIGLSLMLCPAVLNLRFPILVETSGKARALKLVLPNRMKRMRGGQQGYVSHLYCYPFDVLLKAGPRRAYIPRFGERREAEAINFRNPVATFTILHYRNAILLSDLFAYPF